MVVDAEQHGFEDAGLGKGALDHQEGGAGEIDLALGVAPHVAGEPIGRQPLGHVVVDDVVLAEEAQRLVVEAEVLDGVEGASDPRDHAVAAPFGEAAGKEFEDTAPEGGASAHRGTHHRELVMIGQQGRRHVTRD